LIHELLLCQLLMLSIYNAAMDNLLASGTLFRRLFDANSPQALWTAVDSLLSSISERNGGRTASEIFEEADSIVLFGAGSFAKSVLRSWEDSGHKPGYVLDSQFERWGSLWQGFPLLQPRALMDDKSNPLVVVTAMFTHEIEAFLKSWGGTYLFAERDGTLGFLPGHWLAANRHRFSAVYEKLSDDASRTVLLSMAKARMFQTFHFPMKGNWFAVECSTYPAYFPEDLIQFSEGARLVDCGAYDGDTVIDFASQMWKRGIIDWMAIAFEPDPDNARRTMETINRFGLNKVTVLTKAIGRIGTSTSGLSINNCRSHITDIESKDITTIDEAACSFCPTFIKMDIEGSELDGLRGAHNTIIRFRPTLAICTYHTTSDLVNIPYYILNRYPFYNVYIRHHRAGSLWETVCYAVPV